MASPGSPCRCSASRPRGPTSSHSGWRRRWRCWGASDRSRAPSGSFSSVAGGAVRRPHHALQLNQMAVDSGTVQVVMPAMGDSVAEGTVLEWRKGVGDPVAVDETIVEISTDKVDAEVPSPVAGTITKIVAAEGETVSVGAVLAEISTDGSATGSANGGPAAPPVPVTDESP